MKIFQVLGVLTFIGIIGAVILVVYGVTKDEPYYNPMRTVFDEDGNRIQVS